MAYPTPSAPPVSSASVYPIAGTGVPPPYGYAQAASAAAAAATEYRPPAAITAPPTYPTTYPTEPIPDEYRLEEFRKIANKYEIRPDFCARLRKLEEFSIILIADDSGSMNTQVVNSVSSTSAFAPAQTRWGELKEFANIVVEIASLMDRDGIDIYFLNRSPIRNIRHSTDPDLNTGFRAPASGTTPLVSTLNRIYAEKCARNKENKFLIIIATDGEPDEGIEKFKDALKTRPSNTFVSILACTDDERAVDYLNYIDTIIPGLDVVDDYQSELREIRKVQGKDFRFSFGDYVVKVLLGSIDPELDALDEKRLPSGGLTRVEGKTHSGGDSADCCMGCICA